MADTLAAVQATRTELFRRETRGEEITDEEWEALGERQQKLTESWYNEQGYMTRLLP